MKPDHWMPLYIGDYLRDTLGLGRAEHGSYMLLIFAYWTNSGPLPADDDSLREIAKCHPREWARTKGLMLRYFKEENGFWFHKRLDSLLAQSTTVYKKRCERTKKAREAKQAAAATTTPPATTPVTSPVTTPVTDIATPPATTHVDTPVTGIQPQPQPQPESERERAASPPALKFKKPSIEQLQLHFAKIGLPETEAPKFWNYHESKGWRIGKSPMKSWQAAATTWKLRWEEYRQETRPQRQNEGRYAV